MVSRNSKKAIGFNMLTRSRIEKALVTIITVAFVSASGAYMDVQFLKEKTEKLQSRVQTVEKSVNDIKSLQCMMAIATIKKEDDKTLANEICK